MSQNLFVRFFRNLTDIRQSRGSKSDIFNWVKIFKNGPSKIFGRQPLNNLKWYGLPKQTISLQIFKGCLPQVLLGLFLNTLTQLFFWKTLTKAKKDPFCMFLCMKLACLLFLVPLLYFPGLFSVMIGIPLLLRTFCPFLTFNT